MTPLPNITVFLKGTDQFGVLSQIFVPATDMTDPVRTIGLGGDTLSLTVRRFSSTGVVVWPPADWDIAGDVSVQFGFELGPQIELARYRIVRDEPINFGVSVPDHSGVGAVVPNEHRLTLVNRMGYLRDGRGGRITEGTINAVDENGMVIVGGPTWRAAFDNIQTLAGQMGYMFASTDLSIGSTPDVGPLDWGNARAIDELDGMLNRIGFSAAETLDGQTLNVFRLPRAGEAVTPPTALDDQAEPFLLGAANAIRGARVLVTSGRTRVTVVTDRILGELEWVAYDPRTNTWGNAAFWTATYPGEIGPDDIAAYRAGQPRDEPRRSQWNRLYHALRVADASDWQRTRHMVPLPIVVRGGDGAVVNSAAMVRAVAAIAQGGNQLRNAPDAGAALIRFEGARAHVPAGVIELPSDVEFVRLSPGPAGTRESAVALASDQLVVAFAHESSTGDRLRDYYWRGFTASLVNGALTLTPVATDAELSGMIDDPETLVIEAPFLQVVEDRTFTTDVPPVEVTTQVNRAVIDAAAAQLAQARAAAGLALSGVITLRGLRPIVPGAFGGIVSSVRWSLSSMATILTINQHEAPQGFLDQIAFDSARSFAAGLDRYSTPGSSAALGDVRGGSSPGSTIVPGGSP